MGAVESGDYHHEVLEQPRAEHAGPAAEPSDYDAFADFARTFSGMTARESFSWYYKIAFFQFRNGILMFKDDDSD